ncbi:S-layer homology domain-containing protein [Sporosarcina sp. ACRSL]|uniref:S-layer homology domain-containing protein n=1 Tax=Sporosarcina sp. ACRSL TaxID=2918215 RepID=UPI001EF5F1FC|nr:S-layer homology domain-containing protein [Sporosarcina sp. ACRSL]MCG7343980.1 S-layer homology domain-containing protein [Sporosarcina sp. ACRSL]
MKNSARKSFLSALSLSLAAGAVVVAAPTSADAATSFRDVPTDLDHHDSIMSLAERGIITGYEDGTFRPDAKLTRAHASKIIAMSLGLNTTNVKDPGFKDINENQWYYGYVAALANAGYITGFEDGTFRPNAPMTRAQTAKILDLSYKLPKAAADNPFTDVSNSAWYVNHVRTLVENKVTKGKTPTTFEPNANVTRAHMASFVVRSENFQKVTKAVEETKAQIRAIVNENSVIEKDGEKIAEASFDPTSNTLTLTAYDLDEGIKAVQGLGFFSDKLPALGLTDIRIGDGEPVNVIENRTAAKQQIQDAMVDLLKTPSNTANGDLVADDIKVRLLGHTGDVEFWDDFNVNLHVFIGE